MTGENTWDESWAFLGTWRHISGGGGEGNRIIHQIGDQELSEDDIFVNM